MRQSGELGEQEILDLSQSDPDDVLLELDRLDSEEKLVKFIERFWDVLEPGREFHGGWHIDAICDHLEAVTRGDITRLLINVPPGCMKSLTTDAFWPAWEWGPMDMPQLRYVSASYSQELTVRDNRRCRSLITSPKYRLLWGSRFQLVGDQNSKLRFDNDKMGFKIATSVGGLGTGERGDRFIVDDPHNVKDGESLAKRTETVLWFREVVQNRTNDPRLSAIVTIMQCVADGDVSAVAKELGYDHLMLPMELEPERKCFIEVTGFVDPRTEENELLWPTRMTREIVERDRKAMGEYAYAAQYQQRPSPRGGGMFKRDWWNFYKTGHASRPFDVTDREAIELPPLDWSLISVDATFKSTTTGSRVGMFVIAGRGAQRFVLDNLTGPKGFGKTVDDILALVKKYPRVSRTLIEDKANGPAIVDTLISKVSGIIAVNPQGGKEARAAAMQPSVEAGQWYLPEGAPWLDDFITEFALFPSSAKDDQVDACSQASIYMAQGAIVTRALALGKM